MKKPIARQVCTLTLLCGFVGTPADLAAQGIPTREKAATNAELRAEVAALKGELAGLRRDHEVLVVACTAQAPVATGETDRFDTARADAEQRAFIEANDREFIEQQRRLEDASWYVKDLDFGVTERNNVFMRFGWKVTVKNATPRTQLYDIEVQFLDSRGLIVETDRLYRQVIVAQDEQTLRGDVLISLPAALKVTQIHAVAKRHPEAR